MRLVGAAALAAEGGANSEDGLSDGGEVGGDDVVAGTPSGLDHTGVDLLDVDQKGRKTAVDAGDGVAERLQGGGADLVDGALEGAEDLEEDLLGVVDEGLLLDVGLAALADLGGGRRDDVDDVVELSLDRGDGSRLLGRGRRVRKSGAGRVDVGGVDLDLAGAAAQDVAGRGRGGRLGGGRGHLVGGGLAGLVGRGLVGGDLVRGGLADLVGGLASLSTSGSGESAHEDSRGGEDDVDRDLHFVGWLSECCSK